MRNRIVTLFVGVTSATFLMVGAHAFAAQEEEAPASDETKTSEAEATAEETQASEQQTASAAAAEEEEKKPKKICKKTRITGSSFTKKVCATKEEWEASAQASKESLDRLDRKNREGCAAAQNC